nr:hypothetical protein [uncultured Blautia sp.]
MAIFVNGKLVAGSGGGSSSGHGIPAGGAAGQVLAKKSAANYDTQWVDASGAGSGTGGGFVEMETSIPVANRVQNTLYGLILQKY